MKKRLVSLVLILSTITISAQTNDPVVMKINGKDVKKSEFEYIYNKNNNEDAIDKRSLDEYITLFKNFKLRVAEAETQGIDTTASFLKELNEYRSQLAKPYLTDLEENEDLLKQSYNRAQKVAELSAILIAFPQLESGRNFNVTPADTLAVYKKALEVREKALKKGADFEELVKEYTFDERSKQGDRPGYLGWYSGLNLAPSLEAPIFATAPGKVTMPIRVPQGYYLIKVHNAKPNPGEVNASHILISLPEDADAVQIADAESKVAEVSKKLDEGVPFADLAKEYSADSGSATKGGNLSWFPFGQMVPEFNDAVFAMTEKGAVSQPIKSKFGYHIIQLLDKKPVASYEELRNQLENKAERSGNYTSLHQPGIDKLKATYHYSVNENEYKSLAAASTDLFPTDSLYITSFENNTTPVFTIDGKQITAADFAAYLKSNPRAYSNLSTEAFTEKWDQFVYQKLIDTEDKNLENKYPEFKNLMQEYRDGILLFEVSNKEVWDKASTDTEGLTTFFEANKSNYAWNEPHWKGYVISVKDAKLKKQMQKETAKMSNDDAVQYLLEKYKTDSIAQVKVEKGLFTKGQNPYVDEAIFQSGVAERPEAYQDFFLLGKLLPKLPDSYTDVRGLVITDYQDYLEKEWLKSLNEKYPVTIYTEAIK
ncbi:MAG: peptidylprolyl isomerase [Candidatus Symbiothrix sp.]|jgi:peptidyl-prolyl cis-trans isomerase SurA|nr:peptidylprolyl isomerase [Candidatus Symbiothrix sp.]